MSDGWEHAGGGSTDIPVQRSRKKPVGYLENPPRRLFRARGSFVHRCDGCRLPATHCICRFRTALATCSSCAPGETCIHCEPAAEFWLLMHPEEQYKPTNTGRLIADCLPQTRIFTWHRKDAPPGFLELCQDPAYNPMIVFPAPPDRYEDRLITRPPVSTGKPAFILLDGTWQQAGKMFRLTRYLQTLPVLSLNPDYPSRYRLRRTVHAGQLCTAEIAAELLKLADAEESAQNLHRYLSIFSDHYTAARNNQPAPEAARADPQKG